MGPHRDPSPSGRPYWVLVAILGALTAFAPMSIDMYLPSLPALAAALGTDAAAAQSTLAAFFLGLAIGQLFYGPLSDRLGRRGPLLAGIGLYIAATIACALAQSVDSLTVLRFVQALGGCAGVVIARAVVRDRFEVQDSARVYSLLMLVMGLAPILAPLLGGYVLALTGWRGIFWALAIFGAAVGLAVLGALPESRPAAVAAQARQESALRAYSALLRSRAFLGYILTGALSSAALFTYIACSPHLIIETFGFSPQSFGWVFGLNAFGLIAATQVNRLLLARRSARHILRCANLAGLGFAVLLFAGAASGIGGQWGVLVPLFLVLANLGFTQPNALASAMAVNPQRAGSASGLFGTFQFTLGAIASTVAGTLHDGSARPMALVIAVVLGLAVLALNGVAERAPPPAD
ncbi:MAG: multidrug effflux MFS transporter [Alphaproteobacteria bacterium]